MTKPFELGGSFRYFENAEVSHPTLRDDIDPAREARNALTVLQPTGKTETSMTVEIPFLDLLRLLVKVVDTVRGHTWCLGIY